MSEVPKVFSSQLSTTLYVKLVDSITDESFMQISLIISSFCDFLALAESQAFVDVVVALRGIGNDFNAL